MKEYNAVVDGALVAEQKETFQDASFAVSVLGMLKGEVPEDEMQSTCVEVNAGALRNCLELMLSMLESYEDLDVSCIEAFQQSKGYFGEMVSKSIVVDNLLH